jgi:ABC-type polysaccharide/polyol phosphate transport system ATPase subunit
VEKASSTTTSDSGDSDAVVLRIAGLGKKFSRVPAATRVPGLRRLVRTMAGFADAPAPVHLGKQEFWALHDINFSLRRGEALGVVGLNGAGKSTLLKIILDRLRPDVGSVHVTGRPGGLIELAAGFHPEMSGRENISLNASLLGASAAQIELLTPAIIAFADIGTFIDSPVKVYSSGMKVRLGFAIAIHFLADLLVFDEILSVGDFEFRQKCLHKINALRAERTFLLVSHNLRDISLFCDRALLLHKGEQILLGEPAEVLAAYSLCHRQLSADQVRAKLADPSAPAPDSEAPASSPWKALKRRFQRRPAADPATPDQPPDLSPDLRNYLFGAEFLAAEKIRDVAFRWNLPRNPHGFYYLAGTPWEAEISFTLLAPAPHLRVSVPFFNREGELILAPDTRPAVAPSRLSPHGAATGPSSVVPPRPPSIEHAPPLPASQPEIPNSKPETPSSSPSSPSETVNRKPQTVNSVPLSAASLAPGPHRLRLTLAPLPVNQGTYWVYLSITDDPAHLFRQYLANFTIHNPAQAFGLVQSHPAWSLADNSQTPNLTPLL